MSIQWIKPWMWIVVGFMLAEVVRNTTWHCEFLYPSIDHSKNSSHLTELVLYNSSPVEFSNAVVVLPVVPFGVVADRISTVDYLSDNGYNDEIVAQLEQSHIVLLSRWYIGLYWFVGESIYYNIANNGSELDIIYFDFDKSEWKVRVTFHHVSDNFYQIL